MPWKKLYLCVSATLYVTLRSASKNEEVDLLELVTKNCHVFYFAFFCTCTFPLVSMYNFISFAGLYMVFIALLFYIHMSLVLYSDVYT